jgi:preprotein translocase subunit Sec61beta
MKKLILFLGVAILAIGSLLAQTERQYMNIDTLDVATVNATVIDATSEITTSDLDASDSTTTVYLVASQTITGRTMVVLNTAATVVLAADSCMNMVCWNDDADAIHYTLPAASAGLVRAFGDAAGGAITIDPYDGVDYVVLNGVSAGAGSEIISDGTAGRYIVLVAIDDTRWMSLPTAGWADNE